MEKKDDRPEEPKKGSSALPLNRISIGGFKTFRDRTELEIRPLTVLAGANSSGKSSAIQALLLLKQTLETAYDPGPLLLNGLNVKLTDFDGQVLWRGRGTSDRADEIFISLGRDDKQLDIGLFFRKNDSGDIEINRMECNDGGRNFTLREGEKHEGDYPIFTTKLDELQDTISLHPEVTRMRCFLGYSVKMEDINGSGRPALTWWVSPADAFGPSLIRIIHLPGLRGNPNRMYQLEPGGPGFPGDFTRYVAGILARWQDNKDARLGATSETLAQLGLTWKVEARRLTDAEAELRVGRLPKPQRGGAKDMVSIADVGVGVSQVLPVIVALQEAEQGQIVYIEQPEIHLHPSAQINLARPLLEAAKRGVIVIVETHSRMLLLGIQERIASGEDYNPDLAKLHWFSRDEDGATTVEHADFDENGAYGDWPVDFADVSMDIERKYLDASFKPVDE